jgi:hypothetical protein
LLGNETVSINLPLAWNRHKAKIDSNLYRHLFLNRTS